MYIYTCAHTCQAVELECEFPFDDLRDNPDGKPGKLSEGKGAWNPEHFIDNLPDTVVKVCVYMLGPLGPPYRFKCPCIHIYAHIFRDVFT